MASANLIIRKGEERDLLFLVALFNHYVVNSYATFDTHASTIEEKIDWFRSYSDGAHRLVVAEDDGQVLGYASSSLYRQYPAFRDTVETSIYLDPGSRGGGVGTCLYSELLSQLRQTGVHLAVAGVALPNDASLALHRKLGFDEVGVFREYARKGTERISSMWFQCRIIPYSGVE